jgi:AcrR family transcriptional regulator
MLALLDTGWYPILTSILATMSSTSRAGVTPHTPRPRREQVRARVLEAASAVVAERGLGAATLDQVAAAAGFTKGAVYSNFASKDELFLALLEEQVDRRVASVESALRTAGDLPAALAAVGADLARPDPVTQLLSVEFWQRAVRDPRVRTDFVRFRRDLRRRIARVVQDVLDTRPVAPGWDADSLALVVVALANGLALEALPDPDAVPDGLVARVLGALLEPGGGLVEVVPDGAGRPADDAHAGADVRRNLPTSGR